MREESSANLLTGQGGGEELGAVYAAVLRALVGATGSRAVAEDALQDAVEAALRKRHAAGIERLDAWLYVVALRSARRGIWRRRFETSLGLARPAKTHGAPGRLEVLELLNDLTQRQRDFVIARFYLDLDYREIASQFGVTVNTATSTVSQALTRLRVKLNEERLGTTGCTRKTIS